MDEQPDHSKLRLWLNFWKFVLGTVALGAFSIVINWQIQDQKLDLERQRHEQEYLGDYVEQALDDNLEKRVRFAHYFSSLTLGSDLQNRWSAYHEDLVKEQTSKQALLEQTREALAAEDARQQDSSVDAGLLEELRQQVRTLTSELTRARQDSVPQQPNFTLRGCKWPDANLQYRFRSGSAEQHEVVRRALGLWSDASALTFVEVSATQDADLSLSWVTAEHGDGVPFFGDGPPYAHAFFPPPCGGPRAGELHFSTDTDWSLDISSPGVSLFQIAAHEIGHVLGLSHSDTPGSLMNPILATNFVELAAADVAGIRTLYGGPSSDRGSS